MARFRIINRDYGVKRRMEGKTFGSLYKDEQQEKKMVSLN
jgi:hypothetical protein